MIGYVRGTFAVSLVAIIIIGCATAEPPAPTLDIQATVQAQVQATVEAIPTATPDIKATVQAQVQATVEAVPTAIPTPEPTATLIPTPTAIPTPTPRPTPTPTLAPLPVVLPTPSPTIDVAVYVEYDAWISGFGDRMVFNIEHFTQRVFEQPQGDYWRSRMEEIATTFIDGHKEAAEINAPPLFEPAHAKFVEGLASYAALGSLLRTWINSGSALTEQQLAAWIQMLENGQSLLYEAADLMPVVEGYEAINVDAAGSINLEGRGQQASSKFNLGEGLAIFKMTHNGSSNFSIWLLDNRGGSIELLVNEIGSFNGSKAVQIEVAGVYLLDISADGRWTVKIEQ